MTKMILEAGGRRREFELGDGRLTLGSGESASLRVKARDLADIHLEVMIEDGVVRVAPRAGVLPPKLAGIPKADPFELKPGKVLSIGVLKLWVEADEDEDLPVVVRSRAAGGKRRPGGARRHAPTAKSGMPTWAVLSIALVVLGGGGFLLKQGLFAQAKSTVPVAVALEAAEDHLQHGNLKIATEKLDSIDVAQASTAEQGRLQELRARIDREHELAEIDSWNLIGDDYFEIHLEHYAKKWLVGTPALSKVRLFLERCDEFKERWPHHPKLDWIERQERRFQGHVDMRLPRTWEDIEWALEYLVNQPNRNYTRAFELVDEFVARAEGEDLILATTRRDEMLAERPRYHAEKMEEARTEFEENEEQAKAVFILLHGVIWSGDEELADKSARTLARIPEVVMHLRGYRKKYPDRLQQVLAHPRLAGIRDQVEASE